MTTNPQIDSRQPSKDYDETEEAKFIASHEEEFLLVKHEKRLGGAIISIVCAAAIPCVIIFLVSGVLIGLLIVHRVTLNPGWPELRPRPKSTTSTSIIAEAREFENLGGSGVYYVNFNPSSLSTIASWTGKMTPYLSSSIMALVAFFVASHILQASRNGQREALLTPHQLTLLLGLLSGGTESLWDTARYRFRRGRRLQTPLPYAFTALVLVTFIGFLIPIADSWFGIATTTVSKPQFQIATPPKASFGRGIINSSCSENGYYQPCNIKIKQGDSDLAKADEGYKTLLGISDTNIVRQYSPRPGQVIYFLGDVRSSKHVDFKANTLGVSTQCKPITSKCDIGDFDLRFNCTPSFAGYLTFSGSVGLDDSEDKRHSLVGIQFFKDPGLTKNISSLESYSPQNPLYFGTWATKQQFTSYSHDPDILHSGSVVDTRGNWILNCSSTIYEASYTWVNGGVTGLNATLANGSVGGIFSAAFAGGYAITPLQNAATIAGFSSNAKQLANSTANSISQAAVALAVGAMSSRANILEQSRSILSLTRVPKFPLYILLALKFLYALSAILLAIAAICFTRPAETQEVKARLSIKGLAAATFEPEAQNKQAVNNLEEMFAEHNIESNEEAKRVGIVKTEQGGWVYVEIGVEVLKEALHLVKAVVKGTSGG